jgi:hypothetical protein
MKNKYLKYFGFALAIILFFILIKLSNVIEFAKNTKVETQEDKIILIVGVRTVTAQIVDNFDSLVDSQAECRASGNSVQTKTAGSQ